MYRLTVETHIDAAHYIKHYVGKCQREHGHRWKIAVTLVATNLDELNMVVDFAEVKGLLKSYVVEKLDHYQLNEVLTEPNLTAEYLAKWIYDRLQLTHWALSSRSRGIEIVAVTVWESPECGVTYYEEKKLG